MKLNAQFFSSNVGQLLLVGGLVVIGGVAFAWQQRGKPALKTVAAVPATRSLALPQIFTREAAHTPKPVPVAAAPVMHAPAHAGPLVAVPVPKPATLPLVLVAAPLPVPSPAAKWAAPYGRLIPCETITALESNRLETPVIGLVTEDVWHDGKRVIPAGTEVHGKAALDRTRERLAVEGAWHLVWRTGDTENGIDVIVNGLALDRERNAGEFGEHDGSAGLRGLVLKTADDRELKLFAATFLSTATTALQGTQATTGLLGAVALPAATVRNATLAGTSALLRDYAQTLREAIARDGFYLRVPAGKPFYLYVTQPIERSALAAKETSTPHSP